MKEAFIMDVPLQSKLPHCNVAFAADLILLNHSCMSQWGSESQLRGARSLLPLLQNPQRYTNRVKENKS